MSATHTATLVRGNCYIKGGKRFDKGEAVPVNEEEAADLKEITDSLSDGEGGTFERPKFKVEKVKKSAQPEPEAEDEDEGDDEGEDAEVEAADDDKPKTSRRSRKRSR